MSAQCLQIYEIEVCVMGFVTTDKFLDTRHCECTVAEYYKFVNAFSVYNCYRVRNDQVEHAGASWHFGCEYNLHFLPV